MRKKIWILLTGIALLLLLPTATYAADGDFAGGDGSANNPYRITDAKDLYAFAEMVNQGDYDACAVLDNDITLNQNFKADQFAVDDIGTLTYAGGAVPDTFQQWTPIGTDQKNAYTGIFDGNSHTISGLYIHCEDVEQSQIFAGLFGWSAGTIRNVTIANSYLCGSNDKGSVYVGGICGYHMLQRKNDSIIQNVEITDSYIIGSNSKGSANVGGICGENFGTILNSTNSATISGTGDDVVIGGICADNARGEIRNSSNSGAVSGTGNDVMLGGICGRNDSGMVYNSSNSGTVSGEGSDIRFGGVSGYNSKSGSIINSSNNGAVNGIFNGSKEDVYVDGVCGYNVGTISNSHSSVDHTVTQNPQAATTAKPQYTIAVSQSEHGSVTVSQERAQEGDRVQITAVPQAGYVLESITVTDAAGNPVTYDRQRYNIYRFQMPASNVEIDVVFSVSAAHAMPAIRFQDVEEDDWFYDAVCYVVEHDLMYGMNENTFSPYTLLYREMLAFILYHMEQQPPNSEQSTFTDVKTDAWYTDAIMWASENGIVSGYGDTFGVGSGITREQFAVILYRYAQYKGYDTTQGGMAIREFSDYDEISDYAMTAMTWAVNTGMVSGMEDGTLAPKGAVTRMQAAMLLKRFCETVVTSA